MGGSHDLENLLTLCADCHAELHGVDDEDCVRAGAGPTVVGATFESLPGPLGPWVARVVDALSVALFIAVGASVLALSIPGIQLGETLAPVWTLLVAAHAADGVALAWIVSVLGVQLLLASQPLIRRLPPETVPAPPAGTWQQWALGGSVMATVALGGMLFEATVVVGPSVAIDLQSWVLAYALGSSIVVVTTGAAVVGAESTAGATRRWRRLCVVLGTATVASAALLASAELAPGLAAPVVLGLVAARRWTPGE
mgnify:CR=1 FL=1